MRYAIDDKGNKIPIDSAFSQQCDAVEKPSHYVKGGMECIDVINAVVVDCGPQEAYLIGNVIKYLWRFKQKNGKEDVAKARKYIDMLLARME